MKIIVWNNQGASEQHHAGSYSECVAWLDNTWGDPINLKAKIYDNGVLVREKDMGDDVFYAVDERGIRIENGI